VIFDLSMLLLKATPARRCGFRQMSDLRSNVSGGKGEYFDPGHGRLMKEWVAVGTRQSPWAELARESYRFVKGKPGVAYPLCRSVNPIGRNFVGGWGPVSGRIRVQNLWIKGDCDEGVS